jgi:rhodanese-related sulfurtransferase
MIAISLPARELAFPEADREVTSGAVYVDPRTVADYLDVHIPGSICLQYEFGPGMPGRARDCIPLDTPLVVLNDPTCDMQVVAAALRGKGFAVHGYLNDGLRLWAEHNGTPASAETVEGPQRPEGTLLNVGDPGSALTEDALYIPLEELWRRVDEVDGERIVIAAGRGVRAAMAVGMLERAGHTDIVFWKARP